MNEYLIQDSKPAMKYKQTKDLPELNYEKERDFCPDKKHLNKRLFQKRDENRGI
jgi:hypothetical protein